jgi:hypothetical protein
VSEGSGDRASGAAEVVSGGGGGAQHCVQVEEGGVTELLRIIPVEGTSADPKVPPTMDVADVLFTALRWGMPRPVSIREISGHSGARTFAFDEQYVLKVSNSFMSDQHAQQVLSFQNSIAPTSASEVLGAADGRLFATFGKCRHPGRSCDKVYRAEWSFG